MKGYIVQSELLIQQEEPKLLRVFVGCSNCMSTWYEEQLTVPSSAYAINGPRYKYNACDNCYDPSTSKYTKGGAAFTAFTIKLNGEQGDKG